MMIAGYAEALEQQIATLQWLQSDPEEHDLPHIKALEQAEPFFWSTQCCQLIEKVAISIPDYTLTESSLPTPHGFMWFQKPLVLPANLYANDYLPISAISWNVNSERDGCVFVGFYSIHNLNRCAPTSASWLQFGKSIFSEFSELVNYNKHMHYYHREEFDIKIRCISACLSFIEQNILIAPHIEVPRSTRRRMPPKEILPIEPFVHVVQLRRKIYQEPSHVQPSANPAEWSCQWFVRGHWRQQWYPGSKIHKPKWIAPYVKGPEDKPLKTPRTTLFAVTR